MIMKTRALLRSRLGQLLVAIALLLLPLTVMANGTAVLAAAPSKHQTADEAGPMNTVSGPDRARMLAQIPAMRAVERIMAEVNRGRHAGYGNVVLEDAEVVLYWHGVLPAQIRHAIQEARRHASVRVAPARYSQAQLQAASARVGALMRAQPEGPIHAVGSLPDASGLSVSVDQGAAQAERVALPDLGVRTEITPSPRLTMKSRLDDSPPWWVEPASAGLPARVLRALGSVAPWTLGST